MKVTVMIKVKAKTGKEAKELVTSILNRAICEEEWKGKDNKFQSWGWLKEFKK